jgi:hypothetical protein
MILAACMMAAAIVILLWSACACGKLEDEAMTEIEIQRQIVEYLEATGHIVFRMNAGRGRYNQHLCPNGTPDLLTFRKSDGKPWWIEVKQPGQVPTAVQEEMHDRLRPLGHILCVANSVRDIEQCIRLDAAEGN